MDGGSAWLQRKLQNIQLKTLVSSAFVGGSKWLLRNASIIVAIAACLGTWYNARTAKQNMLINAGFNNKNQENALFIQFQQQYVNISSKFPPKYLEGNFKPARGSEDYGKLQSYWFFCFSEWYATTKLNPLSSEELWESYYIPLISGGINTPSLRYVFEDMVDNYEMKSASWRHFLKQILLIAQKSGHPLSKRTQDRIGEMN